MTLLDVTDWLLGLCEKTWLAKPLVEAGLCDSPEKFLRDIIKNIASERIKTYERIISKHEKRYGNFEKLTKKLKGKAKPNLEDE